MKAKIFIDGEAGTTGLQIRERLEGRADLTFISLDETNRKDEKARRDALNEADVAILCLPDQAARDAAAMVENSDTALIDASTAHRTDPDWVYGFAEMTANQTAKIKAAKRVSNPGCYPQGVIANIRPLIEEGLLPESLPLTVNAFSGYTGGGRQMVEAYEDAEDPIQDIVRPYGLSLSHKHVPEMRDYSLLTHAPVFVPTVAAYRQGMIDLIPLNLEALGLDLTAKAVRDSLSARYHQSRFISVSPLETSAAMPHLCAEIHNGTNLMTLHVFADASENRMMLAAVYDNLGKGASGAAVQNLNIILGVDEATGHFMLPH